MKKSHPTFIFALACFSAVTAFAADSGTYEISIKNHAFTPDRIEIPANTKVTIAVKNEDTTPEEFESHDLKREKVIPGGGKANIVVGPLKAGVYTFVGEYHEDTAKGTIVVK